MQKNRRINLIMKIIYILLLIISIVMLIYGTISVKWLKKEEYLYRLNKEKSRGEKYRKDSKKLIGDESINLIHLADLHGMEFGENNEKLVSAIAESKPDIICVSGDMIVKRGEGLDECINLMKKIVGICDVYFAPGNHEKEYEFNQDFYQKIEDAGVKVLQNRYESICIKGFRLNIYGLDLDRYYYHYFFEKRNFTKSNLTDYLGEASDDGVNILLAHNPEYFDAYADWGADMVLSGHVHGGIVRLPVLGGVIDPSLRLFPKYDSGVFNRGKTTMFLSRGLGTHDLNMRFFNNPEISLIRITGI